MGFLEECLEIGPDFAGICFVSPFLAIHLENSRAFNNAVRCCDYLLWQIQNTTSNISKVLDKVRVRQIPKRRLIRFENLEYGNNIYPKTWDGNLVLWEQYLSTNIKKTFDNMGSISNNQHEVDIWYFQVKEPTIETILIFSIESVVCK